MTTCEHGLKKHQWHLDELCDDCRNRTCREAGLVPHEKKRQIVTTMEEDEWYELLLDDLASTILHHQETVMDEIRKCWWNVGETITRVLDTHAKEITVEKVVQRVAHDLRQRHPDRGMSKRTFQYALAFYRKFPNKDKIPQKSWRKIIEQDLTEQKALAAEHECEYVERCKTCGKVKK